MAAERVETDNSQIPQSGLSEPRNQGGIGSVNIPVKPQGALIGESVVVFIDTPL